MPIFIHSAEHNVACRLLNAMLIGKECKQLRQGTLRTSPTSSCGFPNNWRAKKKEKGGLVRWPFNPIIKKREKKKKQTHTHKKGK